MRAMFSYASILHAVGQLLDQVGVSSFAIHEEEEGLFIEGFPFLAYVVLVAGSALE